MTNSRIEEVLERYEDALTALKKEVEDSPIKDSEFNNVSIDKLPVKQVLDVLVARDALQKQLENRDNPAKILVKVSELDRKLREQFKAFSQKICQEEQRKIVIQLKDLQNVCKKPQKKAW
ncbi:MAG: hypothetical protein QNJ41_03580 [Xenococcaceae cyanobacterium MO_188.B32]|nr:hypothetical protein [Xenococcaceae cyanobacterium MO_188.B32]